MGYYDEHFHCLDCEWTGDGEVAEYIHQRDNPGHRTILEDVK